MTDEEETSIIPVYHMYTAQNIAFDLVSSLEFLSVLFIRTYLYTVFRTPIFTGAHI